MLTMITVKLVIGFVGLWIITFVIGRRSISHVTPLDFFTAILLSEIVGSAIYEDNTKYIHVIYALALWSGMAYGLEKLSLRFSKIHRLTDGKAILIVDNGVVNQKLLKSCKLDFTQLATMLREKGIFNFGEIAYVLFETNGSISVIKKPEFENVRVSDLDLKVRQETPAVPVIDEGEILKEAFQGKKIDADKIRELARKQGFPDIKQIAYAELHGEDELRVIEKEKKE